MKSPIFALRAFINPSEARRASAEYWKRCPKFSALRKDQVLFWAVLAFIGGILVASFSLFSLTLASVFLGLAVALAGFAVFPGPGVFALFFLGIFFGAGYFRAEDSLRSFEKISGGETLAEGRIIMDPQEKSFYRETIVEPERCLEGVCPEKRILWQAPLTSPYGPGDRLFFRCVLEIPENFAADFDYRMFLAKDGVGYLCRDMEVLGRLPADFRGKALQALFEPKHFFEKGLSHALPEPEAGLAKGLLLGGDNYLAKDFEDAFRAVGLSHVVAVSGYNITLIIECFLWLGLAAGLWRRQALYGALLGIVLFVLMIGLPTSAIRAACMASLVFLAWEVGRVTRPLPILLSAAGGMLLINPLLLRYDIGFQLSFLATLAIITALPFERRVFPKDFFGVSLLKIFWLTVIVNIFVLPVILYHFHVFSPLSLLANGLVVLVPLAMAFSFFASLFSSVPVLGVIGAIPAYLTLFLMTWSVERLSRLALAQVEVASFSVTHLIFWYALLLFVMMILEKYRKRLRYVYPL